MSGVNLAVMWSRQYTCWDGDSNSHASCSSSCFYLQRWRGHGCERKATNTALSWVLCSLCWGKRGGAVYTVVWARTTSVRCLTLASWLEPMSGWFTSSIPATSFHLGLVTVVAFVTGKDGMPAGVSRPVTAAFHSTTFSDVHIFVPSQQRIFAFLCMYSCYSDFAWPGQFVEKRWLLPPVPVA